MATSHVLKRNNVQFHSHSGPILLFVHGFGCDQSMWRYIIEDYVSQFTVVTVDLVGFGDSDSSLYSFNKYDQLYGHAHDLIELIEDQQWKDVIFVGHSVSSMIGLVLAKKRPELLSHLIMVSPSPCYINKEAYFGGFEENDIHDLLDTMDANYLGWSSSITPVIMDNPEKPELTEELKNSFCRTDPKIAKHFGRVTFLSDNRADLPLVSTPTFIIQSQTDAIAPIQVGIYIQESMPHASLEVIPSVGHCPHLSHPSETSAALRGYLIASGFI